MLKDLVEMLALANLPRVDGIEQQMLKARVSRSSSLRFGMCGARVPAELVPPRQGEWLVEGVVDGLNDLAAPATRTRPHFGADRQLPRPWRSTPTASAT